MATKLHLDPELAAIVERARQRAVDSGELPRGPFRTFQSSLSPQEADVIVGWRRDGGYDEAIAQIAAEDPDLASE